MVKSLERVKWLDLVELRWTMDVVRFVKPLELVKLLRQLDFGGFDEIGAGGRVTSTYDPQSRRHTVSYKCPRSRRYARGLSAVRWTEYNFP